MGEGKHTEWKAAWREECLKWVCGFANAQGGVLEIGKNDKGKIIGIANAEKLLEDLPNKIRDILGIIPEIDHVKERGKSLILIKIKPYRHPVNYKGGFYYRSGSTNQELRGSALQHFLLEKTGQTWDGIPVPRVSVSAFDAQVISKFRQMAVESGRLPLDIMKKTDASLLKKQLNLKEEGSFRRAAVLLFHPDPEKYIVGAHIKLGCFRNDAEMLYHDDIHGDLFTQVNRTMDLLFTKYLKALVSYKGLYRVETYPAPKSALREAVLNAVIHRDYSTGSPIQIRVYGDKIILRNTCRLPEGWTTKNIAQRNQSRPHNPYIAKTFFWANMVEAWGHGIRKMRAECKAHGAPPPKILCYPADICVEFRNHDADMRKKPVKAMDSQRAKKKKLSEDRGETREKTRVKIRKETRVKTREKIISLIVANPRIAIRELSGKTGVSEKGIEWQMSALKQAGHIKRIGPAKGGYWKVSQTAKGEGS